MSLIMLQEANPERVFFKMPILFGIEKERREK